MTRLAESATWNSKPSGQRLTHINRRVARQIKKLLPELSTEGQSKLLWDFRRLIAFHECEIISGREKHRLFHCRASCGGGIRICFCPVAGVGAVVVDVAHHDDFEAFAYHFNGSLGDYLPIEECQIMKKETCDSRSPEPEVPSTATERATLVEPAGAETAELLARLIFGSRTASQRHRSIDDTIEKCMEVARDSATAAVRTAVEWIKGQIAERDSELKAVKERVEDQGTTLETLKGRITDREAAVTALENRVVAGEIAGNAAAGSLRCGLNALVSQAADERRGVKTHLEKQAAKIASVEAYVQESRTSCQHEIGEVHARMAKVDGRMGEFARGAHARLDALSAAMATERKLGLPSRVDRLTASVDVLARRMEERDGRLDATTSAVASCRDEVATLKLKLAASEERERLLADRLAAHDSLLFSLVAQINGEREERAKKRLKARWLSLVAAASAAVSGGRRFLRSPH
jgi:hypothetical protein